jgi:type IX secretion system PorP/SprF family membrane protein
MGMRTRINLLFSAAVIAAMFGTINDVVAQQIFRRSQYLVNPYLSNPAVAGTTNETPISAMYRNQWAGFDGAPRTTVISGHTRLPNKLGVGGILYSDNMGGAFKQTGMELTGTYTIDLNNYDAVSFGLSAMAAQWSFDGTNLEVWDVNDPALIGMQSGMVFDANFGMMIFGDEYAFGFSIPALLQSSTNLPGTSIVQDAPDNQMIRHFRFMGHYRYDVNNDFSVETAGLIRMTGRTSAQLDAYLRGTYAKMVWAMLGLRANDAVVVGVGADYKEYGFGYTYDVTNTNASYLSPHTHELTVTYRIPRNNGFNSNSMGSRRMLQRNRIVK